MSSSITTIYIRKLRYDQAKEKFLTSLEKAFLAGETIVEVVHGVGTYALRTMIIEELKSIDYASAIETGFAMNPGTIRIELYPPDSSVLRKYIDS